MINPLQKMPRPGKILLFKYLYFRRYWLVPFALLALFVGQSMINSISEIRHHSFQIATVGARNMVDVVKMTRLWNAHLGNIYAPVSAQVTPNPYLLIPDRDIETVNGLKLTLINPAYMTRQIAEIAEENNIFFHITSNKPLRPANKPDTWEQKTLQRFEQGDGTEFSELVSEEKPSLFRYMSALPVEKPCLRCHATQGYTLGDIRGGISISLPSDAIFGKDAQRIRNVVFKHILVFGTLSALFLLFLSQLRRQWMELDATRRRQESVIEERTAHLKKSNELLQTENTERQKVEEKYRSVSQSAYDGIISCEEDGSISSWNKGAERIFGYDADEVLGNSLTMLVPENQRESYLRDFSRIVGSGKFDIAGNTIEVIGLRQSGSEFPLELSLGTWESDDGLKNFTAVMRDITERELSEQDQRLAATVFANTAEGLIITDTNFKIVAVNPSFTTITGFNEDEILGKTPEIIKSERHEDDFYWELRSILEDTGCWQGEIWTKRKDGVVYPSLVSVSVVHDSQGNISQYVGAFFDISIMKESQKKLDFLAHHDSLTNLPNRRLFTERLSRVLLKARRNNSFVAILFIDLDHFKTVNDSLGHQVGDKLLQAVSARMLEVLRESDTVARLGGDEFTVLLEDLESSDDLLVVVGKLMQVFKKSFLIDGHTLYVTPSIGISIYPDDGDSVEALLKGADSAMYKAKERGRNQYHFYSEELTTKAVERLALETNMYQALRKKQFRVYYQAQIDIQTETLVGVEALVRWEHPELGLVSPLKFIPLAEDNGLIIEIGYWVMKQACRQAVEWRIAGADFTTISVNVSGKQIQHPNFVKQVADIIRQTGIDPGHLELEITENFIMSQANRAIAVLEELKKLGVRLAIDDFGIGYSSLSYLKRLPIDTLKIDRSFIKDLPEDSDDAAITRAIIALGRSLQLMIIAEGVETKEQLQLLREEKCDQAQGFYFSKAVPANEVRFKS